MSKNYTQSDAIAESIGAPAQEPTQGKRKKSRREYTDDEARAIKDTGETSGHKRVKLDRINLAFLPENYDYVYTMGRVSGEGMTKFVNKIITQHREANMDLYEKAIAFKKSLDDFEF